MTDYLRANPGNPEDVVDEMRAKIRQNTGGLTASAGIAPNTLMAKICSDVQKPNGQFRLKNEKEVSDFIKTLPIRKISGIGNVSEQLLSKALGVKTCSDIYENRGLVSLIFGPASAHFFIRASLGLGSDRLSDSSDRQRKSMSNETTFQATNDITKLEEICRELCNELAENLQRESNLKGKSLTLKIKTENFEVKTKSCKLHNLTNDCNVITEQALKALRAVQEDSKVKLRLMGVRMAEFGTNQQGSGLMKFVDKLTTFQCPVCHDSIRVRDEQAFNMHLDACLGTSSSQIEEEKAAESQESGSFPRAEVDRSSSACSLGEEQSAEPLLCPVCSKVIPDPDQVNSHIDQCLNEKTLSEESSFKRKSVTDQSSQSKRLKTNTIRSYFKNTS